MSGIVGCVALGMPDPENMVFAFWNFVAIWFILAEIKVLPCWQAPQLLSRIFDFRFGRDAFITLFLHWIAEPRQHGGSR